MFKTLKGAITACAMAVCAMALAVPGHAEERIAYKSAKSGTSYYQMGVELAKAVKKGTGRQHTHGRGEPGLRPERQGGRGAQRQLRLHLAAWPRWCRHGRQEAVQGRATEPFSNVRALFPIPSLTMHFVVHSDKDTVSFADLAGKNILLGKGSFGAREGAKYLKLFGLEDKVTIANAELGNAADALKNGQIDGFVTAGSYPAPNVIEASANTPIALVTMTDEEIGKTHRTKQIIPAGTYEGVDKDVATTSLTVDAYTTTGMSDATAYTLTKTFWAQKAAMSGDSRWWKAVEPSLLKGKGIKLHPGALRYYDEAGIKVPDGMR